MAGNAHLNVARKRQNDEFYTKTDTVERELKHYGSKLRGKVIYCNCDDYRSSNFYKYFKHNFSRLGIREVITSNYSETGESFLTRYDGTREEVLKLSGTGSYTGEQDEAVVAALQDAHVIITNPPFSLFKQFIPFLINNAKDFIILGTINAVTYVDIFPYIRDGLIYPGINFNTSEEFYVPDEYEGVVNTSRDGCGRLISTISNIAWYTTFRTCSKSLPVGDVKYNPITHPTYDNYDAIEVSRVKEIPSDFIGVMGVPVNYLSHYSPAEFEIVGSNRGRNQDPSGYYGRSTFLNGRETYKRVFIKRRR